MKKTLIGLLTILFLNVCTAGTLSNFTYMSPTKQNIFWDKLPVKICPAKTLPPAIINSLINATKIWNTAFNKEIFSTVCPIVSPLFGESDPSVHGVYWVIEGFEKYTDKTSLARTLVEYEDSGKMHDADILLNGQYYDWTSLNIDPETVLIHELGHVLGLKHFFLSLNSSMNHYPYVAGYVHRTIGDYERIVISNLYTNSKLEVPPYMQYFFNGDIPKAINELEGFKFKTPEYLYSLAYLYKIQNKFGLAKSNLVKLLENRPHDTFLRQQFGEVLWNMNDLPSAEMEFQRVIKENPKSYEALANLGSIYSDKGESQKAVAYLKKSIAIQPTHWVACAILFKLTREENFKST